MNELLILGIQKVEFKGSKGDMVSYYEMYCLGNDCNTAGNRVITYIVSKSTFDDFFKRYKNLKFEDLIQKSIKDKTTTITASHKLKITSFTI